MTSMDNNEGKQKTKEDWLEGIGGQEEYDGSVVKLAVG